jgi:hypothetical protein
MLSISLAPNVWLAYSTETASLHQLWSGDIDFRIMRGFSVNASANIAWVDDQIYLSAKGTTDEEALLRLRQRATDFDYGFQLGFSIQFGSIFNNVVNNRFRRGRGR